MAKVKVDYYVDVLCVWAYVAQVRVDEMNQNFGDSIRLTLRFVDVFGDCARIADRWDDRGGMAAFGAHVRNVCARFDHVKVHPKLWQRNAPASSMPCHLFLHSVGLAGGQTAMARACSELRRRFFENNVDVSARAAQLEIAESLGLERDAIEGHRDSGRAHAALSRDLRQARESGVKMSPTLLFDEGRQQLAGNVGYRVIEANIRALLEHPKDEPSWC